MDSFFNQTKEDDFVTPIEEIAGLIYFVAKAQEWTIKDTGELAIRIANRWNKES